ncbi:sulfotransferase domain-containing protein [Halalkalibacter urbisdiaboli]|uniref:sulfotransferase domain-containing protein n=1 Tax=Halalkalibacter urbisdiaboli TaxID=1960589 RepID=UPI000B44514A|nr:sulfotransferase domain-containing protein [Halalkalibacter urbisdiaboli]
MSSSSLELPKLLLNTVPKSGSNLLLQIVEGIPEMSREVKSNVYHIKPGKFIIGHFQYNKHFSEVLYQKSIKQLFIYRDLRDVSISLVHFINERFHGHVLYPVFKTELKTFDEQLSAVINGVKPLNWPGVYEKYRGIYDWIKKDALICPIKYEDLVSSEKSRNQVIYQIIDYLFPQLDNKRRHNLFLKMTRNINPEISWTFREGKTGSWRTTFTQYHKQSFKRHAGNFLIELGYEKDLNW